MTRCWGSVPSHQGRDIVRAVADGGQTVRHSGPPHQGDDRPRQDLPGILRPGIGDIGTHQAGGQQVALRVRLPRSSGTRSAR